MDYHDARNTETTRFWLPVVVETPKCMDKQQFKEQEDNSDYTILLFPSDKVLYNFFYKEIVSS